MAARRTKRSFAEELPDLLEEQGLSAHALARKAEVDPSLLSKAVRGVAYKRPSAAMTRKVAEALGLPPDYFYEYREQFVLTKVREDAELREKLYACLRTDA
jgi:transcriptional regulator with XRE-family HTH domain